ncbi:hypothetical protein [Halorussus sp. MSC15.2]|uniref:hypothetical protein n=1 Tax=Halorussus sp. MSC15.2 TaxID=2283638 RepID=UPI0013D2409C|nr:hypothetical protein [Halorussus sp. MSC15.2]NEU56261.1 hypothetical protein [Halorussus sp. MSC15.2]
MSDDAQSDKQSPLRSVATVVAVVLLISTATLTPILGPASPVMRASATHECDGVDMVVAVFSAGLVNGDKCGDNHTSHVIEEMQETEANETEVDIYEGGLSLKSQNRPVLTFAENYITDSETVAWSKARATVLNEYKAGVSESVAKSRARGAVSDYYAQKQLNLIRAWNSTVQQSTYLHNQSVMEEKVNDNFMYASEGEIGSEYTNGTVNGLDTRQVTLVNGSTVTVQTIEVTTDYYANGYHPTNYSVGPIEGAIETGGDGAASPPKGVYVHAPNDNYQTKNVVNFTRWIQANNQIESTQTRLNDNVDKFVNGTYEEYQSGELNASEYTSSLTLAQEYSTKYNETGYWVYAVASLSQTGLETPDLGNTSVMTVETNGQTYTGMVMSQSAPNGSTWEVNETYNPSNIDGVQLLITTDGGKQELTSNFTITEMRNPDGEKIQQTHLKEYNYKTANVSELNRLREDLQELKQEIEEREPTAGGGASGTGLGNVSMEQIAAILAVLAGLALISSRDKQ